MHRTFSLASAGAVTLMLLAACGGGKPPAAVSKTDAHPDAPPSPPQGTANREATPPAPAPPAASKSGPIETRIKREKWHGDLDGIAKRRFIRVLVTPGKLGFYFNGSQMQGIVYDFSREFEKFLNQKIRTGHLGIVAVFIPVAREELIPMLADGSGDLVASLVGISQPRLDMVDFSNPLYDPARTIVITGPGAAPIASLEDLSGKEVYFYQDTLPYARLTQLNESFQKAGKAPIRLVPADPNLQAEDLLEMVHAGLVPMTLAEDKVAQLWVKVMPGIQLHPDVVVAEGPVCWAVQKNTPQLLAAVNEFVQDHRYGTAYGNTIARRYLNDVKWVKDATARKDLERFDELVKLFRKYGDKYEFPYLLLAAQAYQESGLNPELKSPAGAVGVMQIKPSTAAASPIEIPDVQKTDRNIEAGAKYLRYMVDQYYRSEPMNPVTRGLFAIASYNAGPNMIRRLRNDAAQQGYDPNLWFNNVEIIASRRIGRETVQYVSNIYKYYLAYKMVTDRETERQAARQNSASRATR